MKSEDGLSGSQHIINELSRNKSSDTQIDQLNRWLNDKPTNRDLYDSMFEQLQINIAIGEAIVFSIGDDRSAKIKSVNEMLRRLRGQTRSLAALAKRGFEKGLDGAFAGDPDEE